ncbi:hypothetical protein [Ottowia beijingensis]|uniref:hypothetical protein n=1 Tax=Ottowia beijingensis TaxID=1207057 RepID=UPI00214D19E7|nr:hypothetical protein [Ottowia beijingensis]
MKLKPYAEVDGLPFTVRRADLQRRHGAPLRERGNGIGLTELDYGDVVFRFQDGSGRLEEVTRRAAVLYLLLDGDVVDVPFAGLAALCPRTMVRRSSGRAFWSARASGSPSCPASPTG